MQGPVGSYRTSLNQASESCTREPPASRAAASMSRAPSRQISSWAEQSARTALGSLLSTFASSCLLGADASDLC